jgi:hypothetical protein
MKNKRIKQTCIVVAGILVLSTTGCKSHLNEKTQISISTESTDNAVSKDDIKNNVSATQAGEDDSTAVEENNDQVNKTADGKKNKSPEPVVPAATREVPIYTVNETTQEVESVVALVNEEDVLTPELIVNLVKDSMSDRLIEIGIDQVKTEKDTVIVSFISKQSPLIGVSSNLEKTILDAIAQSLVDNLPDYPKVIFRVDGNAYVSEHFKFDVNQVYLDGTKTK